jgi:ABC-type oligopeptide transport system substrate-binding subunit
VHRRMNLSMPQLALRATALLLTVALAVLAASPAAPVSAQGEVRARIAGGAPLTWDPAKAGETSSVGVIAQVFETLTAFDAQNRVQPALARSWSVSDDGRQIIFELRPDLRYSDGSPITAQDVVESWFRVLEPANPSPLVSILADVAGANEYLAGTASREEVGLRAEGSSVIVDLRRPASFFLAVTGSPTLAVVPPAMHGRLDGPVMPQALVVSGAYVPTAQTASGIVLEANPHYWAGEPALGAIEIVNDLGGVSPVTAFERGDIDYVRIGSYDASWIRYDPRLGPQLREVNDFTVHYYGFDTTVPPFDDARVRRAFGQAVDWQRMVSLADLKPATSMVPAGIPGRGDQDFRPAFDPDEARRWLAEAGYPDGAGFPEISLISNGYGFEVAVADQLESVLGIRVGVEFMDFSDYLGIRRTVNRPHFWNIAWSADYPHVHDFLGLLLETGSTSNEGEWSNADYDALIEQAAATDDPAEQETLYTQAQHILRHEVPVIPVENSGGWALSRDGLLGAAPSGVGYLRYAGLAWAEGHGR